MLRKIIRIDGNKCNGCGLCANACHEGAIVLVNGKASLLREDFCDGFGDCLPACPTGAISFETREAAPYDHAAVSKSKAAKSSVLPTASGEGQKKPLSNWPIQIKLLTENSPCFNGADLLIAADCTAFAFGEFHSLFQKDKVTLIACPKLDGVDYTEKLSRIISENDVKSVTVLRMQVPCCAGIERAAKTAVERSGKTIPFTLSVISADGKICL